MDKKLRVSMVSLGCNKNQVDGEIMLSMLQKSGYEIIADAGLADIVIVNTCGFIADAKAEAIENILEFCTLKKEGRIKKILVTGCLSERYREEVLREIPEIDAAIGIGKNKDIVEIVERVLKDEVVEAFGEKTDLPLSGDRVLTNPPHYVYIKIAEGCSNSCTYCAIPMIRGKFRSRKMEDIISEARYFIENGVSEINLIAQDTTGYGIDLYGKYMLSELLSELCKIDGNFKIRILYCYPDKMTDELIETIKREDKIVKYIDLPLQHINDRILKRMNRKGSKKEILELIEKIRAEIPEVIIRSTLITGFPGETEEEFEELCEFVKEYRIDRLGCFPYSQEEGTKAAELDGQLDEETKNERAEIIMDEQYTVMENKAQSMIGKTIDVLLEGYDKYAGVFISRSYMDAPDIDPKVFFMGNQALNVGEFYKVKITDIQGFDLIGELV